MKKFDDILDLAYRIGVIENKPEGYDEREELKNEKDLDLSEISSEDLHDLLLLRGREIGYREALNEFLGKDYLCQDDCYELKDTLFAILLKEELKNEKKTKKAE